MLMRHSLSDLEHCCCTTFFGSLFLLLHPTRDSDHFRPTKREQNWHDAKFFKLNYTQKFFTNCIKRSKAPTTSMVINDSEHLLNGFMVFSVKLIWANLHDHLLQDETPSSPRPFRSKLIGLNSRSVFF